MPKPIEILKVKIDPLTWSEIRERLLYLLNKKGKSQIVTINSEFIVQAQENADFLECLNNSQLRVADGSGILTGAHFLETHLTNIPVFRQIQAFFKLIWFLKLSFICPRAIKNPIPDRIAGVDLSREIIKLAAENSLSVFLLGAGAGVAQMAALKLQTDNYMLKIAGTYSGSPRIEDEEKIVELINKHKADIILVAYGAPKQDLWIRRNLKKTTAKLAVGIGGTLDIFSGDVKRAPLWMQRRGLEWFFRLTRQPVVRIKRLSLLTRYLKLVYKERLRNHSTS